MPFNGSGTFVPIAAPAYPAIAGQTIVAAYYNSFTNDLMANGLSLTVPRDGQAAMTGPLNLGNQKLINLAAPVLPLDGVNKTYADTAITTAITAMAAVVVPIATGGTGAITAAAARTALGVTATGADSAYATPASAGVQASAAQAAAIAASLQRASNLSDLGSPTTARTNLGGNALGNRFVQPIGADPTSAVGDIVYEY